MIIILLFTFVKIDCCSLLIGTKNLVLEKMNFPNGFIIFLKKLYNTSVSKVMVNGFLSQAFKLSGGSKRGDPLSLYIFIIVLNVLIVFLNNNDQLLPFVSNANKKFLAQCFADDLNLATKSLNTLARGGTLVGFFGSLSKSPGITTFLGRVSAPLVPGTIYLVIGSKMAECPSPKRPKRALFTKIHAN